jgi:hypothetical protein
VVAGAEFVTPPCSQEAAAHLGVVGIVATGADGA